MMSRKTTVFRDTPVSHTFRWRDRTGTFHAPAEMETRHLFHVFRMIWNNSAPEEMRVGEVRLYSFGPNYTTRYMRDAVVAIGRELATRDDLTSDWLRQLMQIAAYFREDIFSEVRTINGPRSLLTHG